MSETKVSIIMPVYNAEYYINEAIESVQNQTLKELEIICINDGSKDNSQQIIEKYKKEDSRIVCITTENQGAGRARNCGINIARGKYIFFLDSDDYLYSSSILEKLFFLAEENNVLISGGNCCFDKNGKHVIENQILRYNFLEDGLKEYKDYQVDYYYWRFLYNREMLIKNNFYFPDYKRYQDPPFMVKVMTHCKKFVATLDIVYCYRYSYKSMVWTEEKCIGYIMGMRDEVLLAKQMHYDELYLILFKRMYSGWAHDAFINALHDYYSAVVEECIDQIRSCIDIIFLKANGVKLDNSIWKLPDYYENVGYPKTFLQELRSPQGVIFYGAGIVGERMVKQFKLKYWDNIIGFAVTDSQKEKKDVLGIPVFQIDQLSEYKDTANVFISTSPNLHKEIRDSLYEKGFKNVYSIDWSDLKRSSWF